MNSQLTTERVCIKMIKIGVLDVLTRLEYKILILEVTYPLNKDDSFP